MNLFFIIRQLLIIAALIFSVSISTAHAADATSKPVEKAPDQILDLEHQKTLYVVGYAHLDTQWRWSYPQVIREFIRGTMEDNFPLFKKYPHYVFNFTGSRRYEFMKEYYPDDFARVQHAVATGHWFPAGASVDEGDAIISGLESRVRHVLYGNQFFEREFHKQSDEVMLPDTFGFPACMPSILAHCGIKGFSTQKLTWGSAVGIPFNLGQWEGVDGQSVVAALNPGSYGGEITSDLSKDSAWSDRLQKDGDKSGIYADFTYFGTGDRGGAPDAHSVKWLERSVANDGPVRIISAAGDRLFDDLTPAQKAKLPVYRGELLLSGHSTGSLTSKAFMKRFNRKNELLADSAETAATAAYALGALPYPTDKLYSAWDLVLGSQMHDMLPGTCLPKAYEFTWNDEILAANQFASITENSSAAVIASMDTRVAVGAIPIVVYNPLSILREDVVEASLSVPDSSQVVVYDSDGQPVPTQIESQSGNHTTLLFLAKAPSNGYAVYEARPASAGTTIETARLKVSPTSLENDRYRVAVNEAGDVSSIFDKAANKEILKSPAQLVFQYENPKEWPAWNMDWVDRQKPPEAIVDGPAEVSVVESGPVRVCLQVKRSAMGSTFVQRIRLAAGEAGNRVELATQIDWRSLQSSVKASFSFGVSNPMATYDAQLGTVQRGNNNEKKFEVPQYQWMDLTDSDGSYGVSVLNDSKYGSDKPDDQTLRLTLLYSPGVRDAYQDQATQDFGRHQMLYAIEGHPGDWRKGDTSWEAARLNQPMIAFSAAAHAGPLGKSFSLFGLNSKQVQISSIKKAEGSNEIIMRVRELSGLPAQGVQLKSAVPVAAAREVNGQEAEIGSASLENGAVSFDLSPYQLRAFALQLGQTTNSSTQKIVSQVVSLPYNLRAASSQDDRAKGNFDGYGHSYPAEQFPSTLTRDGVSFQFAAAARKNAVICRGQSIKLPSGNFNRIYLIASSVGGDQQGSFQIGSNSLPLTVQDWSQFIGQWDKRLWKGPMPELTYEWKNDLDGLVPGYVKPAVLAAYCSHRHAVRHGNEFYQYAYFFKYSFDLPSGVDRLTLPDNDNIRVFAITVATDPGGGTVALAPLSDTFDDHVSGAAPEASPAPGKFTNMVKVSLVPPLYYQNGHLHYTVDGTDPTLHSPIYKESLVINHDTRLKAIEFESKGQPGQMFNGHYEIEKGG